MSNMMIKAEMSREDKLYSMKGDMLIAECDKLGVKVSCNKSRTQLKESKSKVIDRILAFESEVDSSISVSDESVVEDTNDIADTSEKKETNTIDLDVESFCEKNQLTMHTAAKKNTYYIKLNSKTLKLRVTKKNYICYKSGKYDNGTYEEKSNRTKYVLTSLTDLLTLA